MCFAPLDLPGGSQSIVPKEGAASGFESVQDPFDFLLLFGSSRLALNQSAGPFDGTSTPEAAAQGAKGAESSPATGPGVGADVLSTLFRPFAKSASEAARTAAGVGLGLALCRRYARAMGGDVCHQPSDQGSCFVLTLPLAASMS